MADSEAPIVEGGGGGDDGGRGRRRGGRRRGPGGDDGGRGEDRGFGGRRRRGPRRARGRGGKDDEIQWTPVTKLGRLVKDGKIKYLEEIFLHSLSLKEPQIIDFFLKDILKDEVMKISPVQKQTRAGQRTRFKAFVVVGDLDGHVGLGVKCSKEVATGSRRYQQCQTLNCTSS